MTNEEIVAACRKHYTVHSNDCSHSGEAENHDGNDRSVTQSDKG